MSLEAFGFLRPWWLLALLALPLLPLWWRRLASRQGGWERVVDPHLLAAQLQRGGRRSAAPLWLALLASLLAVLALAGPAWREAPQPLQQREAALAIALEVSDSMRSTDAKPDRLARARFAVTDLLRQRRDGQFALVAFSGAAFTVAPVTDDATTLLALLDALDPAVMPVAGSDAGAAIAHAADLLAAAGHASGDILLVADAADAAAPAAAAAAAERGYRVSVLGVGTAAGAPVVLPDGGFLKDADGTIVVPALASEALAEVAAAGGGEYRASTGAVVDFAGLGLLSPGDGRGRFDASEEERLQRVDDGPWLLLLLLPLAALAFRRGWLGCLLLAALLAPPPPASAAPAAAVADPAAAPAAATAGPAAAAEGNPAAGGLQWSALWQRPDQRAWEALQRDDAATAAALAESPALRGAALYRAGDAAAASEAFAAAEGADAHYNRGNALAKAERYEDAMAAYDQALALQPGMEDAIANRRAVEEWLERQQAENEQSDPQQGEGEPSPQEQGEGEPQEGEGEPSEGEPQPDGKPQGQDGKQRQGEQPGESSDPEQAPPEQAGDEQAFAEAMQQALEQAQQEEGERTATDPAEAEQRQAVEQWLRRVPDDPGGLLRRKFLLEYQRRQREGGP